MKWKILRVIKAKVFRRNELNNFNNKLDFIKKF